MVSTDILISENQFDWFKGVDTEANVRNHIRQMLQNIKSQYIKKLFEEEQFELQNSDFSSKVFLHTKTKKSKATKHYKEDTVEKVYREHLSNIYQRFY